MNPDVEYRRHLSEGRFMLQRCRGSGAFIFYPRVAEPATGATDLEWVEASGHGTVYSTTVVRQKPPRANYNVALIELAEGPRMPCRCAAAGFPPISRPRQGRPGAPGSSS